MTERDPTLGSGSNPGSSYTPGKPAEPSAPSTSTTKAAASETVTSASTTAKQAGGDLKSKLNEDWQSAKSTAQAELDHATQRARDAADEQKNYAAERVSGFAAAIEKVGDELERGDKGEQREIGRYAKQIGSSINRFADDIKGKDMAQVAGMAEDFGRRQPAAFIGLAALAGFAASRFLTASAERRASTDVGSNTGRSSDMTSRSVGSPATSTPTTPVSPASGAGYATGYSPEGTRNG
ncbi:nutrient deprivation-induced protein [Rhizobium halophilum]|uniref:nutrient deprivation-induced protein n=1 Tax=Rhizobium halophilum TaxID=2846852 RepID=UPI001EFE3647|nr:nutrient deprivation-induced protein [Rhizobium halophilum]MCF6369267.1 nutrient deprivation-induced protein [Rhizobium halophilum]